MKKRLVVSIWSTLLIFSLVALASGCKKKPGTKGPVGNKKPYAAKFYVAGMGGHFAVANVTINPNDAEQPIKINDLNRIDIGSKKTHPTHDPRIDSNDRNILYWSTYKLDGKEHKSGNLHVGKTDLKTGKVLKDVAVPRPPRAKTDVAFYCASAQTKDSYMPISMSDEGFIDVFDKKTMKLKHRIFMDAVGYKAHTYTFAHGTNSPDGKKFLLTLNLSPEGFLKLTGKTKLIYLDMAELEKGKIKKLAEGEVQGKAGGPTITFRQYFTADGKYIFQSGADRGFMIDAENLKLIKEITSMDGENHDIIPTPDGKYAVMTLRSKIKNSKGADIQDGALQLFDIEAKQIVGKSVSVCYGCHKDADMQASSALCGIEANWN
jgi:hypothetical protein